MQRFVFVDEDGDVYGPLAEHEVVPWILDDLTDEESEATEADKAMYRAMTRESLIAEYCDTIRGRLVEISEPTEEWRKEAISDAARR